MQQTEWYEETETRAYTGETQAIPQVRPAPRPFTLTRDHILIIIGALAIWYMAGKSGNIGPQPDPAWQPPPPRITYHIEDRSWNMCGLCYSPNVSPHITIEGQ